MQFDTNIHRLALAAAALLLPFAVASAPATAQTAAAAEVAVAGPQGVWLDQNGRGAIEIVQCGVDGASGLCGRLVWVKEPARAKTACGLQIIGDVKPVDAGTWDGGWIYSPERRSKFSVELKPIDGDSLQVMGYFGSKDLSETMIWHRAPADLARCGGETQAEAPRAGYVPAKVAALSEAPAASDKAEPQKAAPSGESSGKRRDTAERGQRERRVANCNVRAPFVNVSFRCSAKASRVLARLF